MEAIFGYRLAGLAGNRTRRFALALVLAGFATSTATLSAEIERQKVGEAATSLVGASPVDLGLKSNLASYESPNSLRAGGPMIFDGGTPDGLDGRNIVAFGTVDNFTLSSNSLIESFRIWLLPSAQFNGIMTVTIYADAGGAPGAIVGNYSTTVFSYTPTGNFPFGIQEHELICDFDTPVSLAAGSYWFQPRANGGCQSASIFWSSGGSLAPDALQSAPLQCNGPFLPFNSASKNCAFQLFGESDDECDTPERDEFRTASIGAEDGYVREPNLIAMAEGPAVAKGTVAQIGDDSANWQNRGVFSFDTSGIPDDAEITTATLRLTRASSAGNVAPLGNLVLDMGGSLIGATAALDTFDYDDASAASLDVATSFPLPGGNGFTTFAAIDPAFFANFDLEGKTQFRVRFENLTDNDNQSDYIAFHTGEAAATVRPELIVEYATGECVTFPETDPCDGPFEVTLWSLPAQDGGVGESHYTSEVGGSSNAGSGTSAVGDTGSRTQQKLLLHFDTSAIPTDATITSAALRLYRSSATGAAAASLGPLVVDMRNPYTGDANFGTSDALEAEDFQSYAQFQGVATLTVPASNTYTETFLDATGLQAINKGGATQMRVRFTLPDDGDFLADQVNFGTGNFGATSPGRPRLVVTYMTPCP